MLLRVVDGALASLIFVAPLVLGGRHDVGRLAFAAFASVAGVAWFARQALLGLPSRPPKSALLFIAAAALVLLLQVTPLPATWIAWLTPRTAAVLPLWAGGDLPGTLGAWSTISVEPESTRLCLAMFAAYALAFVTVHERVATREDAARLVLWVGLSAGMMAVVGIVQLAVPNGKFLWIYEHPTREAVRLSAAFANRNHFAHFVALGAPALAGWLALRAWGVSRGPTPAAADRWAPRGGRVLRATAPAAVAAGAWGVRGWLQGRRGSIGAWGVAALLGVCCAAVVLSCSRGGAAALAVSGGVMATALARGGLLRGSRLAGAAAGGVILFLAVSFTGYDQVVDRLGTLTAQSLDEVDAGSGRRRIWQANLAAIADGGWWGAGAGAHESIYPLYINELPDHHYTHAESSYLQIVTENGVPGALLAAAGLALAVRACWRALRRASTAEGLALAGACTAALAASAAHALFDFVWYIPACVGSMLVLWACAWRLGGLPEAVSAASPVRVAPAAVRSRTALPWAAAGSLCAAYAVVQLLPPAAAAPHWDAYLRMADAHRDHAARSLAAAPASAAEIADRQAADAATFEAMIHALQRVTARRPAFAAAHRMLANRCVQLFNLRMDQSDNRFPLSQVRDCAMQQNFASAGALRAWLTRAVSGHERLLYEAWGHAQQAAALAPLEGDSYVRLGELCFLAGADFATADAYLQQATLARPYDGNLLFEAGRQWGGRGLDEWASTCWVRAF
ncbi:MAG TPA: O-antigen ligase family protein, partial [Lacipirellulaceae bacterium]|nr:O-antigen ligase family protein [Lacipirellulaceae bacterium]